MGHKHLSILVEINIRDFYCAWSFKTGWHSCPSSVFSVETVSPNVLSPACQGHWLRAEIEEAADNDRQLNERNWSQTSLGF
jgi:hypothetical protein